MTKRSNSSSRKRKQLSGREKGPPSKRSKTNHSGTCGEDFNTFTVLELRQFCKDNGLKVSGRKAELVQRLVDFHSSSLDSSSCEEIVIEDSSEIIIEDSLSEGNSIEDSSEIIIEESSEDDASLEIIPEEMIAEKSTQLQNNCKHISKNVHRKSVESILLNPVHWHCERLYSLLDFYLDCLFIFI